MPLVHNGSALDLGDDPKRLSDNVGRFAFFDRGGAWIRSERHAYCVSKGWGIWLPPAVMSFVHLICESRVVEIPVPTEAGAALPRSVSILRCSDIFCAALGLVCAGKVDASSSDSLRLQLLQELVSQVNIPETFVVRMPSRSSRIAALCTAVLDKPCKTGQLVSAASSVGLSVRTVSRLFSEELDTTAAGWRRDVQIATALCLLDNGMQVSTVARMLGFRDSAFSTFFRDRLGYSPRERLRDSAKKQDF
jgi:AraC-like DNA-binding protein